MKIKNVLRVLSFVGLLVAAGALMNLSAFAEEVGPGGKGPKYVEDCVDAAGKPGWRYICDNHNQEPCRMTPCVALNPE